MKAVNIGGVVIGGGNKIAIQSMANIKTEYIDRTVSQILALEKNGCDIVRVAVKDEADAFSIKEIKNFIFFSCPCSSASTSPLSRFWQYPVRPRRFAISQTSSLKPIFCTLPEKRTLILQTSLAGKSGIFALFT